MKVTLLKRRGKKFRDFKNREWIKVHPKLYGKKLNWDYWNGKELILKANEGKKIVGVLTGELVAGVLYVNEVIIDSTLQGKGIGTKLMGEAELWAREQKAHEIYLVTGKAWGAAGFYKHLGYDTVTELQKHYSKIDFLLMRKFLD